MIRYIEHADIFESHADALVNPVNCRGYMGKGLALEFKTRFPEYYLPYQQACDAGRLVPGQLMFVHLIVQPDLFGAKQAVIMFPTKDHWRDKSRLEWIEQGLHYLRQHYREWSLDSVAMPQIGCGLGGLDWKDVKPLIEEYLENEPLSVEVYVGTTSANNETPGSEPIEGSLRAH